MSIATSISVGFGQGLNVGKSGVPFSLLLGNSTPGANFNPAHTPITTLVSKIYSVQSITFQVVCDANVANRRFILNLADNALIGFKSGIVGAPFMVAGNTYEVCCSNCNGSGEAFIQNPATLTQFFVNEPIGRYELTGLGAGYVEIVLNGKQAGDQINNVVVSGIEYTV